MSITFETLVRSSDELKWFSDKLSRFAIRAIERLSKGYLTRVSTELKARSTLKSTKGKKNLKSHNDRLKPDNARDKNRYKSSGLQYLSSFLGCDYVRKQGPYVIVLP